jgi:hypothetical protein
MALFHVGADLPGAVDGRAGDAVGGAGGNVGDVMGGVDRGSGDDMRGVGGEMRGDMGGVMHVPDGGVDEFVAEGGFCVRLGQGGQQSGEAECCGAGDSWLGHQMLPSIIPVCAGYFSACIHEIILGQIGFVGAGIRKSVAIQGIATL